VRFPESILIMQPPETFTVETDKFYCDGGNPAAKPGTPGGDGGHPRVYLTMSREGLVDCPYCGRRFVLAPGAKSAAGH